MRTGPGNRAGPCRYYLDVIAEKLGLKNGSQVMISRTFGKTSSGYEYRLYYAIPKLKSADIHGDAILASLGYSWKSHDLEHHDVTLKSFYRICVSMSPNGIYKIFRKALIAAQLPLLFTTKSNWKGSFPKEILLMFCGQQHLAEPFFTTSTVPVESMSVILRSHKKLTVSEHDDTDHRYFIKAKEEIPGSGKRYRCEVKIISKAQELIESNEEIEFEVGHGSINQHLESVVTQMSVGQYACFSTELPAEGLVLAVATDTVRNRSLL
ncbi:hypothetical protein AALP_AA7G033500 [Arabis alpina]|uniref:Uncharacterized protein n=1 Tax=Arabis alpina TaxID=50452 RepID=A0A087GFN7_ARAAL|nr:hypothetical protein AALP_AA7G033500 [Arabis alpina]